MVWTGRGAQVFVSVSVPSAPSDAKLDWLANLIGWLLKEQFTVTLLKQIKKQELAI